MYSTYYHETSQAWPKDKRYERGTHIWMSADLLDDILIEMSGIAKDASWDIVGMLQPTESG